VAKPKPSKKPEAQSPARESVLQVLPMSLRPGDRLADEAGEWAVLGRPYSTGGGKTVNVRVQRVGGSESQMVRTWGAHEKVSVRRAGRIE